MNPNVKECTCRIAYERPLGVSLIEFCALHSAASDLLVALRDMTCKPGDCNHPWCDRAQQVIAQATA